MPKIRFSLAKPILLGWLLWLHFAFFRPNIPSSRRPLPTPRPSEPFNHTNPLDVLTDLFYGKVYYQSSNVQAHGAQIFRGKSLPARNFKYRFIAISPIRNSVLQSTRYFFTDHRELPSLRKNSGCWNGVISSPIMHQCE